MNKLSNKRILKSIFLLFFLLIFVLQAVNQSKAETINKYIPSLNTNVAELRFYESGSDSTPYDQREYTANFPKSSSRYISWELNLEYPKPDRRIGFEITAIYYRPDGGEFARQNKKAYMKSNWTNSYHNWGWGWSEPENWEVGAYRVDLFIKDQKVASGTFRISSSASGDMVKLENDTDRPGAVHLGRINNVGNERDCLKLCKNDPRCVAFTWVRPGYQGTTGVCWLKGSVTNKVSNKCCVSGIVEEDRQYPTPSKEKKEQPSDDINIPDDLGEL